MIKEGCENESALLILLIFYLKKPQKSNLSLDNKNLKPPKRFTEKAIKALKPCVDVICYTVYELHKEHVWNCFQNSPGASQHCLPDLTHLIQLFSSLVETENGSEKLIRVERKYTKWK